MTAYLETHLVILTVDCSEFHQDSGMRKLVGELW